MNLKEQVLQFYHIEEERESKDLNSTLYQLRHKESGARVAVISNDDENKDFYKLIFSKSVFLNDGRVVLIPIGCTVTKNDEKADYTFEDYPEELILSAEEGAEILAAHEALKEYNKKQNSE